MKAHRLSQGTIWEGSFLEAPLEPGYTLAILDGAYGLQKAAWDRVSLDGLPAWYAPHLSRVSALLAPSASMYVWNTAEGWARLDPGIRALGWEFAGLIVWHKTGAHPALISAAHSGAWPDITEVCGHYKRGVAYHKNTDNIPNVWPLAPIAELGPERLVTGATTKKTRDLLSGAKEYLHPCQKPLAFAERMIRASTRPGERVLVPFGGTCREAVICEWLARSEPEQARRYDVCELNADGVDYLGPVLAQIRGEDPRARAAGQMGLFGGAPGS